MNNTTVANAMTIVTRWARFMRLSSYLLLWCVCTLQSKEEPRAIGQCEISPDGFVGSLLRPISLDGQLRSDLHSVFRDAKADECVRAAPLDQPFGHFSIRAGNVDMEPGVRIDH